MAVCCARIIEAIEKFAPVSLAEEWDNIGLQIGDPSWMVDKVMVSLDLNMDVLEEALSLGVNMLVVHHTPFFHPLKQIRNDAPIGKLIIKMIQKGVSLYTAHTNLDIAPGGVNDVLAKRLDLENIEVLSVTASEQLFKVVVFIPLEYVEKVRVAMSRAGAGWIGNYAECTFQMKGVGTFRPLEGTKPFIGSQNQLEKVEEIRLETIVPEKKLAQVVSLMLSTHPYEEVAFDVYPLKNEGKQQGLGRIGTLHQPMLLEEFLFLIKEKLQLPLVKYCGKLDKKIQKVALCGGSGASLLSQAFLSGAEVYLTGDLKYHEAQEALALGIGIVDAGHYNTEQPVITEVRKFLATELANEKVMVLESKINTDPFRLY